MRTKSGSPLSSGPSYDPLKRVIDVVVATFGLVLLAPIYCVVTGLVRLRLGSPVLFRQQRPGRTGALFELRKFRTMIDGDAPDSERLTNFGRKLRSTSLDELPQLLNVLRGDMSLVGPRPLLPRYLDRYSDRQMRRHEVRPGITGLAQVSGRNAISWDERLELDVVYVERRSLRLDISILLQTVASVAKRRGITDESGSSMKEFGID